MLQLNFSLEGSEVVSRTLGITAEGVQDFKTPLQQIGRNFLKTFDMNFSSRGALYGGWAPRKPQFKAGKRIDTWPLMEKTGKMRKAFRASAGTHQLAIDNRMSYFVYHQSNARRSRLPRRVMMKIRQQDADMIVKSFQAYLVEIARGRGDFGRVGRDYL